MLKRDYLLFFALFAVMALSNAIVPILPEINTNLRDQTFIFSAYFFGAMLLTLPAGLLSEKTGQKVLINIGLIISIISGLSLIFATDTVLIIAGRLIEGFGAGIFIASSLSYISYQKDLKLISYFFATTNIGFLSGYTFTGWLAEETEIAKTGLILFTILLIVSSALIFVFKISSNQKNLDRSLNIFTELFRMLKDNFWLFVTIITVPGITGFVQAAFPELSSISIDEIGLVLAFMSVASIFAALIAPKLKLRPILIIQMMCIMMGILILIFSSFYLSLILMGFIVGLLNFAQLAFLSVREKNQGIAVGLYSVLNYAGMALIPAAGGLLTETYSLKFTCIVFCIISIISVITIRHVR